MDKPLSRPELAVPKKRAGVWVVGALVGIFAAVALLGVYLQRRYGPPPAELYVIAQVPDWQLTDQDGKAFGSQQLKGHVYLAQFVFSRCPSVCPAMLRSMAGLQKLLQDEESVKLITFTVDPDFDTPAVLRDVARQYGANPGKWVFLTHPDKDSLFKLYSQGFKISVAPAKPAEDLFDIAHSEKTVLIDQAGQIRGFYGQEPASLKQLLQDALTLSEE